MTRQDRHVDLNPNWPAQAVIDLDAIRHNVRTLTARAGDAQVMAIVKADAYGHGLVPVARAAVEAGSEWLGVAHAAEAFALRRAGLEVPILTWLVSPHAPFDRFIADDIDVGISTILGLQRAIEAGEAAGQPTRIHIKVDTGLSRNGLIPEDFEAALDILAPAVASNHVTLVGLWSHFAHADEPQHPEDQRQRESLLEALDTILGLGIPRPLIHLANSSATLIGDPAVRLDIARTGIAMYGLTPFPDQASTADLGLRPAMRLESELVNIKPIRAGQGVSYNHRYIASEDTTVGIVPIGYADGIHRTASGFHHGRDAEHPGAPVAVYGRDGHRTDSRIVGTVCMDQIIIDLGPDSTHELGDRVVLFGSGTDGEPTAQDWAEACGTISYEIVTSIGPRIERRYIGEDTTS